jgi:hypothetical protein
VTKQNHHEGGEPMETLMQILEPMLVFVYHCFDRIVINGYVSMLSRPGNVVYFFQQVLGMTCITKEVLSKRTNDYRSWVESYAKNQGIPIEWAEKGVRKEEYVRPYLRKMERKNKFGVYFIFKSMEQGTTFRSVEPKFKTEDPNYRIIKRMRSRFTHYYFYIRDQRLGPMAIRVSSFLPFQTTSYLNGHNFIEQELSRDDISFRKNDNAFVSTQDPAALQEAADRLTPELIFQRLNYWTLIVGPKFSERERKSMNLNRYYAISQIEYCCNFIFKRSFLIRRMFKRSCELGFFLISASKISHVFGWKITRRFKGKLSTMLERVDQGHHTLRAYYKNSFVKQYEKYRTFLRMEVCCNNLPDLRLKKGLQNLPQVREVSLEILDRFAGLQVRSLDAHFDFPFLQKLALPIDCGKSRIAGIKIHDTRMIRLMEALLHAGSTVNGWTSAQIHQTIVKSYDLPHYTINQLRYDLRKMKARGLIQRNGNQYSYFLTDKGVKVSIMLHLLHKRVCGPLANSLFNHRPQSSLAIDSKLEKAYYKADDAINNIFKLLTFNNSERQSLRSST